MACTAHPWRYPWSTGPASLQRPRAHAVRCPTEAIIQAAFCAVGKRRITMSLPRGRDIPVSGPIACHNCLLIILVPGGDRPAFVSYDVFLW